MDKSVCGGLVVGVSVDIQRTDGRVHSATCSAVNPANRSVTVEWFEKGETKGKEIEFDAVFELNPDLAPQRDDVMMPPPNAYQDDQDDIDDDSESLSEEADLSDYVADQAPMPRPRLASTGTRPGLRSSHTHANVPAYAHQQQQQQQQG